MARLSRPAATLFLFVCLQAAQAWAFTAQVTHVHDGDTVTMEDGRRLRLHGIDAPELNQPGGQASRDFLEGLVLGRSVRVRKMNVDAYGRTVALLRLPDGSEINSLMVASGHAWVYRKYCQPCYGMRLEETMARLRGLGLWSQPDPVPPWVWRKTHGRKQ